MRFLWLWIVLVVLFIIVVGTFAWRRPRRGPRVRRAARRVRRRRW